MTANRYRFPPRALALTTRVAWALAIALVVHVAQGASQETWIGIDAHAHPTEGASFKGYLPGNEPLSITVALKLRNAGQLRDHVRMMTTPGSSEFRRWFSGSRIKNDYAPLPERAQAVADYLAGAGFTNINIAPSRLLITATGTAATIRKAFNTELARFARNGREEIANTKDVQVPGSLGDTVLSVLGLQTLNRMHPLNRGAMRILAGGSVHGLNPVSIPLLYNAAALPVAAAASVGIITEGDMTQTIVDLHQFESQNGLATINPVVVQVGAASTDTSGTVEWDIDSQDIQAMAGGWLGSLIFYTAHSLTNADITQALDRVVNDNSAAVINISLGECERATYFDGSMAADDQIFQIAVAQGQTVAVASGDSGSKECVNGSKTPIIGASYPASSPYVIAVGGTTLSVDANGNYAGEATWSGSGGSPSLYEARPGWQSSVVTGSYRGVPDIAFDADPNSGAIIIVNGQSQQWGGTSLAAPLFVGAWARIQVANNARLGFPASWIYNYGAQGTTAYHDVTSGSNGDYSASTGWDYTTGFGSFDVAATALLTQSSVSVDVSPVSITEGMSVTLTAAVTGNSPTGTVQFQVNGVNFDSPVTLVNGMASLTTTQLPVGPDAITAIYSGDPNNAGSSTATVISATVLASSNMNIVPAVPAGGELLLGTVLLFVGLRAALKKHRQQ